MENQIILRNSKGNQPVYTISELAEAVQKSELRDEQKRSFMSDINLLLETYIGNQGMVDARMLHEAACDNNISITIYEAKEYTKADMAHVLTSNNIHSHKYKETDVTDDMLAKFNTEMADLVAKYPELDPMSSEDYLGEADDAFYSSLVGITEPNGIYLFDQSKLPKGKPDEVDEEDVISEGQLYEADDENATMRVNPDNMQHIETALMEDGVSFSNALQKGKHLLKFASKEVYGAAKNAVNSYVNSKAGRAIATGGKMPESKRPKSKDYFKGSKAIPEDLYMPGDGVQVRNTVNGTIQKGTIYTGSKKPFYSKRLDSYLVAVEESKAPVYISRSLILEEEAEDTDITIPYDVYVPDYHTDDHGTDDNAQMACLTAASLLDGDMEEAGVKRSISVDPEGTMVEHENQPGTWYCRFMLTGSENDLFKLLSKTLDVTEEDFKSEYLKEGLSIKPFVRKVNEDKEWVVADFGYNEISGRGGMNILRGVKKGFKSKSEADAYKDSEQKGWDKDEKVFRSMTLDAYNKRDDTEGIGESKVDEASSDSEVVIVSLLRTTIEDDFKEGEIGQRQEWSDKVGIHCKVSEIITQLVKTYSIPDDKQAWTANTGMKDKNKLSLICSFTGDEESAEASESEKAQWKEGKKKLYSVEYDFTIVPVGEAMTIEELGKELGISVDFVTGVSESKNKPTKSIKESLESDNAWVADMRTKHTKEEALQKADEKTAEAKKRRDENNELSAKICDHQADLWKKVAEEDTNEATDNTEHQIPKELHVFKFQNDTAISLLSKHNLKYTSRGQSTDADDAEMTVLMYGLTGSTADYRAFMKEWTEWKKTNPSNLARFNKDGTRRTKPVKSDEALTDDEKTISYMFSVNGGTSEATLKQEAESDLAKYPTIKAVCNDDYEDENRHASITDGSAFLSYQLTGPEKDLYKFVDEIGGGLSDEDEFRSVFLNESKAVLEANWNALKDAIESQLSIEIDKDGIKELSNGDLTFVLNTMSPKISLEDATKLLSSHNIKVGEYDEENAATNEANITDIKKLVKGQKVSISGVVRAWNESESVDLPTSGWIIQSVNPDGDGESGYITAEHPDTKETMDVDFSDIGKSKVANDVNEENITDAHPEHGKMHDVLGIPADDTIEKHYSSGAELAKALTGKVGKEKASQMLNYAANINKNSKEIFKSAAAAMKDITESKTKVNESTVVGKYSALVKKNLLGTSKPDDATINKVADAFSITPDEVRYRVGRYFGWSGWEELGKKLIGDGTIKEAKVNEDTINGDGLSKTTVKEINNLDDVKKWFLEIMQNDDLSFHPDDSFGQYGHLGPDGAWINLYSPDEAARMQALMDKAFDVCDAAGEDIYDIGLQVMKEHGFLPDDFGSEAENTDESKVKFKKAIKEWASHDDPDSSWGSRMLDEEDNEDKSVYSVSVGNVGNIACADKAEAEKTYAEYVEQSNSDSGRASGENVSLMKDGEPIKDHVGKNANESKRGYYARKIREAKANNLKALREKLIADKVNEDLVDDIMKYEDGNMTEEEETAFFQKHQNTLKKMQGHYGRKLKTLTDSGKVTAVDEDMDAAVSESIFIPSSGAAAKIAEAIKNLPAEEKAIKWNICGASIKKGIKMYEVKLEGKKDGITKLKTLLEAKNTDGDVTFTEEEAKDLIKQCYDKSDAMFPDGNTKGKDGGEAEVMMKKNGLGFIIKDLGDAGNIEVFYSKDDKTINAWYNDGSYCINSIADWDGQGEF